MKFIKTNNVKTIDVMDNTQPRIKILGPDEIKRRIEDSPADVREHLKFGVKIAEAIPDEFMSPNQDKMRWGTHMLGALARDPKLWNLWWAEEAHLLGDGKVDKGVKQLMAMYISQSIKSALCVPFHAGAAIVEGASIKETGIIQDFEGKKGELPEKTRVAIEFGKKVAFNPTEVTDEDIKNLKDLGYDDDEIIELVATALLAQKFAAFNKVLSLTR